MVQVIFAACFMVVTLALQLFKRASFYVPSVSRTTLEQDEGITIAVVSACVAVLLVLGFWLVWFMRAACRTGRELKSQPYMPNRFRQLTFRFLLFQQSLVRGCGIVHVCVHARPEHHSNCVIVVVALPCTRLCYSSLVSTHSPPSDSFSTLPAIHVLVATVVGYPTSCLC